MLPTYSEYLQAKEIVTAFENEQKRIYDIRVEAFRKDLEEYFKDTLIDGDYKLEEFELSTNVDFWGGQIIPINPCIEEYYEGGNDKDIEALCDKHGVDFKIAYWCYHK